MNRVFSLSAIAALLLSSAYATTASASFIVPDSPAWTRPTTTAQALGSLTTYQEWDGFNTSVSPGTANSPNNPSSINPNGTATAFDSSYPGDGAFFVGSDIYSFSGVVTPQVVIPEYTVTGQQLNVTAEVQYYGQDINLNDLLVTYTGANGAQDSVQADTLANYSVTNLYSSYSEFGGFGDADQADYVWAFTVPNTSALQLNWGWDVTSSAIQDIAVDTQSVPTTAVPEPATVWMGLVGLAAVVLMKRGRRLGRA